MGSGSGNLFFIYFERARFSLIALSECDFGAGRPALLADLGDVILGGAGGVGEESEGEGGVRAGSLRINLLLDRRVSK